MDTTRWAKITPNNQEIARLFDGTLHDQRPLNVAQSVDAQVNPNGDKPIASCAQGDSENFSSAQCMQPCLDEARSASSVQTDSNGYHDDASVQTPSVQTPSDLISDHSSATMTNHHPMVTRTKSGISKPNPRYANLVLSNFPLEPRNISMALKHSGWRAAMEDELRALHINRTWDLVPRHESMNIVGCKWVFRTKLKADGLLIV